MAPLAAQTHPSERLMSVLAVDVHDIGHPLCELATRPHSPTYAHLAGHMNVIGSVEECDDALSAPGVRRHEVPIREQHQRARFGDRSKVLDDPRRHHGSQPHPSERIGIGILVPSGPRGRTGPGRVRCRPCKLRLLGSYIERDLAFATW